MDFAHSNRGRKSASVPQRDNVCWVFDVDGCLVDSLTGTSLRPGARDLLTRLWAQSRVLLWSAGGDDYARTRAAQFGLDGLVDGYFAKDGRDADGRYLTAHLPLGTGRTVFVDDRPEDLADSFDVIAVSPYLVEDRFDRGLDVALAAAPTEAEPGRPTQGHDTKDRVRRSEERCPGR
jgi:long-chain acyl-CoA synthetase